jgi:protein-S-isoprenylcysteine O-methyltransferase Ste14
MVEGGVKMKGMWKEIVSSVIAVVGLVVVFARLESYNWWLIGSWKGALGVIAVLGLVVFAINAVEMFRFEAWPSFTQNSALLASTLVATNREEGGQARGLLFCYSWARSNSYGRRYTSKD